LDLDRLLHLEDHVRILPGGIRIRRDRTAGFHVELIRKAAALACALLDQDGMSVGYQRLTTRGDQRDTILVRLDLFRDTNTHARLRMVKWLRAHARRLRCRAETQ